MITHSNKYSDLQAMLSSKILPLSFGKMFKNKNQEHIQDNVFPKHDDFQYILRCPSFSTQTDSAVSI